MRRFTLTLATSFALLGLLALLPAAALAGTGARHHQRRHHQRRHHAHHSTGGTACCGSLQPDPGRAEGGSGSGGRGG